MCFKFPIRGMLTSLLRRKSSGGIRMGRKRERKEKKKEREKRVK